MVIKCVLPTSFSSTLLEKERRVPVTLPNQCFMSWVTVWHFQAEAVHSYVWPFRSLFLPCSIVIAIFEIVVAQFIWGSERPSWTEPSCMKWLSTLLSLRVYYNNTTQSILTDILMISWGVEFLHVGRHIHILSPQSLVPDWSHRYIIHFKIHFKNLAW